jgi:hypothetical protein
MAPSLIFHVPINQQLQTQKQQEQDYQKIKERKKSEDRNRAAQVGTVAQVTR